MTANTTNISRVHRRDQVPLKLMPQKIRSLYTKVHCTIMHISKVPGTIMHISKVPTKVPGTKCLKLTKYLKYPALFMPAAARNT